jgi:hypothetical protein
MAWRSYGRAGLDPGRPRRPGHGRWPARRGHGPGGDLRGLGRPVPAVTEQVCGQGVEVTDLAQEQVQHRGDVAALVAQERHRLAGDPHRGHPPPPLVREHGHVIRCPCRPTR